jgi:undecaprenyl pyrophosphate phosphatase UppP
MKNRAGGVVVAVVAIYVLGRIASELIKSGLNVMTFVGCLVIATMIFIVLLLATLRVTKNKHVENTQEDQNETSQFGDSS